MQCPLEDCDEERREDWILHHLRIGHLMVTDEAKELLAQDEKNRRLADGSG